MPIFRAAKAFRSVNVAVSGVLIISLATMAGAQEAPSVPGPSLAPAQDPFPTTIDAAPLLPQADLVQIVAHAHPVVQAVMGLLAAMVFVVVTVLIFKLAEIARAQMRLRQSLVLVSAARRLGGLSQGLPAAPEAGAAVLRLIEAELADLPDRIGAIEAEGLRERCRIGVARVEAAALHRFRSGVGVLAQIAATAPFIGLFGTVFGIMNAFLAIAATKTTSLSVVAPGIAEALLATAIGLCAAIPAVLVYNLLNRRIAVFRHRLGDVAAMAERLLSREIDRRRLALEGR